MAKRSSRKDFLRFVQRCYLIFLISFMVCLWIISSFSDVEPPNLSVSTRSSDPLITGDGFQSACSFVLDEKISPLKLQNFCDTLKNALHFQNRAVPVFVRTELMDSFINFCLRPLADSNDLPGRLLLVSHNSDFSAPYNSHNKRNKNSNHHYNRQVHAILDNPRVIGWYSTNTAIEHPKLWPIPIGIENRKHLFGKHADVYAEEFRDVLRAPPDAWASRRLLFIAFGLSSYPKHRTAVRQRLLASFARAPGNITFIPLKRGYNGRRALAADDVRAYLRQLRAHRFVAAPRGNGIDTHRLWEALYMGCVPVVEQSAMDRRLLAGLPVLRVRSFAEVTPELLASPQAAALATRERFRQAAETALRMDYWRDKISEATRL